MSKFTNSNESISSGLLLWSDRTTQTSISENYSLKIWPVTNILNDGPLQFVIPPQANGLLSDIHIITKLKIQKDGEDLKLRGKNISVINNFANSLWGFVDVILDDRIELTQNLKNAYAYQTYFDHALNSENNRSDYLFYNEIFKMDEGKTKKSEELARVFWKWNSAKDALVESLVESGDDSETTIGKMKEAYWRFQGTDELDTIVKQRLIARLADDFPTDEEEVQLLLEEYRNEGYNTWIPTTFNPAASERSRRINKGESIVLNSKFQNPLFNTSKCLPTGMKVRINLTKNNDEFLLLTNDSSYSVLLEDCYLNVTYYRARDEILKLLDERLSQDPAPYFISRPEIIIKPITHSSRIIRMSNIFHDTLPPYAFFCLQHSSDFEGKLTTNPFTFIPFKKFQFYLDGVPYFTDPLEVGTVSAIRPGDYEYTDFGQFLRQLYKTSGRALRGNCLIDSTNFQLNFVVGISFTADKSTLTEGHLNLQEKASTYLEIDLGIDSNMPEDMVLIVYSLYDRQIQIDGNRRIRIIE